MPGTKEEVVSEVGVSVDGTVAAGPRDDIVREIPTALQRLLVKATVSSYR